MDLGNYKQVLDARVEKAKDTRAVSEWSAALNVFCDRLNEDRGKFPPFRIERLAMMFKGRPVAYIHKTYRECSEARSFGALFSFIAKRDGLNRRKKV